MIDLPSISELWSGETNLEWDSAVAAVRANRTNELRSLGVNVEDALALEAAYNDHDTMCLLGGREMRSARALLGDTPPLKGLDLGRALEEAQKGHQARVDAGLWRPSDVLLGGR